MRFVAGCFIGVFLIASLSLVGFKWWLRQEHPEVNFEVVPLKIDAPHPSSQYTSGWLRHETFGLTFGLPNGMRESRRSSKSITWEDGLTTVVIFQPNKMDFNRYRRSLSNRWDPRALVDRVVLWPRLDSNVRLYEQQIGAWHTFIFESKERELFDLFKGDIHVSVLSLSKQQGEEREEDTTTKDIVSTIQIDFHRTELLSPAQRRDNTVFSTLQ